MKKSNKKTRKIILFSVLALVAAGIIFVAVINLVIVGSTKGKIISLEEASKLSDVDCILVLGCSVKPDGTPSDMLDDRIETAYSLYKVTGSPKILVSGDHGTEDYDEVNTMRSCLLRDGVPSENIFMDHAGFSTYESVYRAREIFGAGKIIIVTQTYHLYRAIYIAEQLGMKTYGVSASLRGYIGQTKRDVREVAARTKDFFQVLFRLKPKYLGDTISLEGSGDVTRDSI